MSVGAFIITLLAQDSCLVRNAMLKRAQWGSNPDLRYAIVMSKPSTSLDETMRQFLLLRIELYNLVPFIFFSLSLLFHNMRNIQ